MNTTVYADVLFLINFMINITLLKITSAFLKRNVRTVRLCVAASIGAIYAVCMFFPAIRFCYIFPVKILISALMVKIITPGSHMIRLIKSTAIFLLVSFTFAGVLLALIYFVGNHCDAVTFVSNGIFYFNIPLGLIASTALISYIIISIATAFFKRSKTLGIRKVKICLRNRECEITALSDTGNLLYDPISRSPVIIAEKNSLKNLFPDGIPDYSLQNSDDIKLRVIPYSSIGKANGMLTGFVPDEVTVDGKKVRDTIIALAESALSPSDEYNALFNPNILNQ